MPPDRGLATFEIMIRSHDTSDVERPIIGWREWVRLPGHTNRPIKVKVDTGARSSALHAEELEPFERDGRRFLRFTLFPEQRTRRDPIRMEALLLDRRTVRSSSGEEEERPVVELPLELGGTQFSVEVTLTRRDRMGFRMLLGRTAVRGHFLVDPSRSYLQGRRKSFQSSTDPSL